jgi:hypothetical protein
LSPGGRIPPAGSSILNGPGYIQPHAEQGVADHVQSLEILIAERDISRIDGRMDFT